MQVKLMLLNCTLNDPVDASFKAFISDNGGSTNNRSVNLLMAPRPTECQGTKSKTSAHPQFAKSLFVRYIPSSSREHVKLVFIVCHQNWFLKSTALSPSYPEEQQDSESEHHKNLSCAWHLILVNCKQHLKQISCSCWACDAANQAQRSYSFMADLILSV